MSSSHVAGDATIGLHFRMANRSRVADLSHPASRDRSSSLSIVKAIDVALSTPLLTIVSSDLLVCEWQNFFGNEPDSYRCMLATFG
jgi:hypothetical protein